jgi:HEAT repeat protein
MGLFLSAIGSPDSYGQEGTDSSAPDSTLSVFMAPDSTSSDSALMEAGQAAPEPIKVVSAYARRLVERFKKSPLFITALYIVILYSIVTLITLLIIILLHRRKRQREQHQKDYLLEIYQELLMDYLFDEEKQDEAFRELNRVAHNPMNRQVLIDQMIDLSVNLKGEIREKIQSLYLRLGLKKDSLRKAHSRKWHENVKGFRELAFMNIREANEKIIESLNSNNEILRMEAQIAMVRLAEENPYQFLDILKKPLSLWEQVTLHELLIQHDLKVPVFKQWFKSENVSVLIYALEMVSWFKQRGVGKEIINLFDHENEQVRETAYRVCGELGLTTSLPPMVKKYPCEVFKNRLQILRTFAKLPQAKYLNFLKNTLDAEENVQLQIEATKAMENTGEPGISMLIKLMKSKSEYKNYQIIIRHVLDGRIY